MKESRLETLRRYEWCLDRSIINLTEAGAILGLIKTDPTDVATFDAVELAQAHVTQSVARLEKELAETRREIRGVEDRS